MDFIELKVLTTYEKLNAGTNINGMNTSICLKRCLKYEYECIYFDVISRIYLPFIMW